MRKPETPETPGPTPFEFNPHVDDTGHSLVFGPVGSGKTTLLSTITTEALRHPGEVKPRHDTPRASRHSRRPSRNPES